MKPRCLADDSILHFGSRTTKERAKALLAAVGIKADDASYRQLLVGARDRGSAAIVLREYFAYREVGDVRSFSR